MSGADAWGRTPAESLAPHGRKALMPVGSPIQAAGLPSVRRVGDGAPPGCRPPSGSVRPSSLFSSLPSRHSIRLPSAMPETGPPRALPGRPGVPGGRASRLFPLNPVSVRGRASRGGASACGPCCSGSKTMSARYVCGPRGPCFFRFPCPAELVQGALFGLCAALWGQLPHREAPRRAGAGASGQAGTPRNPTRSVHEH